MKQLFFYLLIQHGLQTFLPAKSMIIKQYPVTISWVLKASFYKPFSIIRISRHLCPSVRRTASWMLSGTQGTPFPGNPAPHR